MAFYKRVFGPEATPSQFREKVAKKAAEYKTKQQGAEKFVGGEVIGYKKRENAR